MANPSGQDAAKGIDSFPGFPLDSVEPHRSRLSGTKGFLARCYIRRRALASVGITTFFAAAAFSAAGYMDWHLTENGKFIASRSEPVMKVSEPSPDRVPLSEIVEAEEITPPADTADKAVDAIAPQAENMHFSAGSQEVDQPDSAHSQALDPRTVEHSGIDKMEKAAAAMEAQLAALERSGFGLAPAKPGGEEFELRIVQDGTSGFWREGKDGVDEHFIVVEAVSRDGSPVEWEVTDMDSGDTFRASNWAVLVTLEEFSRLSSEKAVSGTFTNSVAALKPEGSDSFEWNIATDGQALVNWREHAE